MFKTGERVKLKNYGGYSDYTEHYGEEGVICEDQDALVDSVFDHSLKWSDGWISNAKTSNLLHTDTGWDEETNV